MFNRIYSLFSRSCFRVKTMNYLAWRIMKKLNKTYLILWKGNFFHYLKWSIFRSVSIRFKWRLWFLLFLFRFYFFEIYFCTARFFCLLKEGEKKNNWLFLLYQYNQCQSVTVSCSFSHTKKHRIDPIVAKNTWEGQFLVCHVLFFFISLFCLNHTGSFALS